MFVIKCISFTSHLHTIMIINNNIVKKGKIREI